MICTQHEKRSLSAIFRRAAIHFPLQLHVGRLELSAHVLLETLAYTVAFLIYRYLRNTTGDPISDAVRWTVITAAAAGGALGSRLLYWGEDPYSTLAHWHDPRYLLNGKTIVGGLIGGLIAVELAKRLVGEKRSTGDLFGVPIALGIAIGRVGCFLQGLPDHTYGIETSMPWGVDFGDGIRRHPTQLYECLFTLTLAACLWRMMRRPHRSGDVFRAFMVSYMTWRLAIDFLKPGVRIFGLSGIQWSCVFMLLYYFGDIRRWALLWFPARAVPSIAAIDPVSERESRG